MAAPYSLTAYIEALENPQQRSLRLRDFYPSVPHTASSLRITHSAIIALLRGEGKEWTLTLPTERHFALSHSDIRQRILTHSKEPYYTYAEFHPSAITLFDSAGKPLVFDAILQERHTPLVEFIRRNCSTKYRIHLRHALESIAYAFHLRHGALSRWNICFDEEGQLKLSDWPTVANGRNDDHLQLGKAAALLYIGASDLEAFKSLAEPATKPEEHTRRLRCILSASEFHGRTALSALASALLAEASRDTIERCTQRLAQEMFSPLPLLSSLLENPHTPHSQIDHYTLPTLPAEECLRVDFGQCDEVTAASDQIVRYRRGNRWGYAYTDGERIVVDREIIGAYDFEEGRAVIRTPRGYGLIDTSGRLIMNDVWEQMCWYSAENVVVAADGMGHWHLYDRMGRQLTAVACDWLGDASEGIVVAKRNGKFGYFTTDGTKRTDFLYEEAYSFSNGLARVKYGGNYYHIDTTFHRKY